MPASELTLTAPRKEASTLSPGGMKGDDAPVVSTVKYTARSTVDEVPGDSTVFSGQTTGEELGNLFSRRPALPGVILFEGERFVGVISQAHFYKCVSRAFGREIYYRRPARIMLQEMTVPPLTLPAERSIPLAVEECLGRPLDLLYEPFLVHNPATSQYRLCAFQDLLLASSQIAALRSGQMEQILNSVAEGLLVIDKNYRIGGEYSRAVSVIFEREHLRDLPLLEVLGPIVEPVICEQLREYLGILFDPRLIDRLIKSINPAKQIIATFVTPDGGRRSKHFALYFERIRSKGEISQVLVRVEDITQRLNLAKELEEQEAAAEEKLQLVMQVLQVEPDSLQRFMANFNQKLPAMIRQVETPDTHKTAEEVVRALFRQAHSLKGEAAMLRLTSYERHLHRLEDQLEKLRSSTRLEQGDLALLKPSLGGLQKLGEQIGEALEQLKHFHSPPAAPTSAARPALKPVSTVSLLSRMIADLSDKLAKPTRFHTALRDEDVPERYRDVLGEALMHLARNSMVHGIENAERRAERKKNPRATIQLDLRNHSEFHEFIFQDDGGGLNVGKLRQRAGQLGWNLQTEEELHNAIFEPGFSTADEVDELAGRGVGLDIIRTSLKEAGGRIVPHSREGDYCAFQILLPKNDALPEAKT